MLSKTMSAFDKYNTSAPRVSNNNSFDNPLLPKAGIPIADDDFVDSTDRIVNGTNTNDVRIDDGCGGCEVEVLFMVQAIWCVLQSCMVCEV